MCLVLVELPKALDRHGLVVSQAISVPVCRSWMPLMQHEKARQERWATEQRELRERAKLWTAAINAEFHGVEPKAVPELYQDPYRSKLF